MYEVTQLSYQSYENLFKCFCHSFNFGTRVDVFIFERNHMALKKLDRFFNDFEFSKPIEFNIFECFDIYDGGDVFSKLEKTVKAIQPPTFTYTLKLENETAQIPCKQLNLF